MRFKVGDRARLAHAIIAHQEQFVGMVLEIVAAGPYAKGEKVTIKFDINDDYIGVAETPPIAIPADYVLRIDSNIFTMAQDWQLEKPVEQKHENKELEHVL